MRGVAELRPLGKEFAQEAEAAFSIETPWQSHGVGSALLERTLLAARNRGIKLLHMACLANNPRMVDLAKKFDAELTFDFGSVVGEVEAAHPTPMSMWREVVADTPRLCDRDARRAEQDAEAGVDARSSCGRAKRSLWSGTRIRCADSEGRYSCRSTISALISAIAFAGLRLFGHALVQFMMVWQR